MLFPARRFKKESLGRDFCVCGGGGWSGDLMGKGYMGVMCKNI